ncbi:MAG: MarR family transcriptional regulator [Candidatus Limnocylindrales bacterium]
MSELFVPSEASSQEPDAVSALVDQVLDQLQPLIASQRRALAHHGCLRAISSTHLHVLFLLDSHGPMPMSRVAELLDVSLPNVTGIVDRMEERKLVERGRDSSDRRVVTVAATQHGRQAVEEIDQIRRRTLAKILGRLTFDQQRRALRTFTDLRAAAEASDEAEGDGHGHIHTTRDSAT